jgi:hypothetical protein
MPKLLTVQIDSGVRKRLLIIRIGIVFHKQIRFIYWYFEKKTRILYRKVFHNAQSLTLIYFIFR